MKVISNFPFKISLTNRKSKQEYTIQGVLATCHCSESNRHWGPSAWVNSTENREKYVDVTVNIDTIFKCIDYNTKTKKN